ncbi:UNVERIFIED_CONTAM: spore germination protein KC [Brevibacillus sp. OAP136]
MMGKHRITCMVLLLAMTLLSGCWDSQELEHRTSVVAFGIERSQTNGQLMLTIQVPIAQKIMGGTGGIKGQEAIRVMSATGKDLREATAHLQMRLNQELFFGHARILVISEEMAREGIDKILDPYRRSPQIRRLMWPMVVKGSSRELLLANPKIEQIPTIFIIDLLRNGARRGLIPDITLGKVFNDYSDQSIEMTMNYVLAKDKEFKWHGLAVFRDDKLRGRLIDDEVWSLLQLRDDKIAGQMDVSCEQNQKGPKKLATFRPKEIQVKKSITPKGNSYRAQYHVRLEGDIIESRCQVDFSQSKNIERLQKELNKEGERRAKRLFAKLQNEYHSDVLGLGKLARATQPNWWNAKMWKKTFSEGYIQATYDVRIRRTGMEMH